TNGNVFTAAGQCQGYGDSGDGGQATQALFEEPAGIVFAPNGDYYVSDASANRIRKVIAATGVIMAYAGTGEAGDTGVGGPAREAKVNGPVGLALDGAGNLYFTERVNDRVKMV